MKRPITRDVRKAIPLGVKLAVALRMLGLHGIKIDYDHDPALALREWNAKAGDFNPPQLDPNFIVIRTKEAHRTKTSGRKGEKRVTSYGSDQHAIGKIRRLTHQQAEVQRAILARPCGDKRRPKGNIRSKGFDKSRTRTFRGKVIPREARQ